MSKDFDPTDLRGQELAKAEQQERQKRTQDAEDEDFRWLMSSKRGRRIVWRLMDQAGVFRISFSQNSMTMAFNEGGRNFGNKILAQITGLCPELLPTLLKENSNVRNSDDGNADHSN